MNQNKHKAGSILCFFVFFFSFNQLNSRFPQSINSAAFTVECQLSSSSCYCSALRSNLFAFWSGLGSHFIRHCCFPQFCCLMMMWFDGHVYSATTLKPSDTAEAYSCIEYCSLVSRPWSFGGTAGSSMGPSKRHTLIQHPAICCCFEQPLCARHCSPPACRRRSNWNASCTRILLINFWMHLIKYPKGWIGPRYFMKIWGGIRVWRRTSTRCDCACCARDCACAAHRRSARGWTGVSECSSDPTCSCFCPPRSRDGCSPSLVVYRSCCAPIHSTHLIFEIRTALSLVTQNSNLICKSNWFWRLNRICRGMSSSMRLSSLGLGSKCSYDRCHRPRCPGRCHGPPQKHGSVFIQICFYADWGIFVVRNYSNFEYFVINEVQIPE